MNPTVDGVELVHWPAEARHADDLHARGIPCILLVAPDADPPLVRDELEDWVRLPAVPADVDVRARRLAELATTRAHRDPTRVNG